MKPNFAERSLRRNVVLQLSAKPHQSRKPHQSFGAEQRSAEIFPLCAVLIASAITAMLFALPGCYRHVINTRGPAAERVNEYEPNVREGEPPPPAPKSGEDEKSKRKPSSR